MRKKKKLIHVDTATHELKKLQTMLSDCNKKKELFKLKLTELKLRKKAKQREVNEVQFLIDKNLESLKDVSSYLEIAKDLKQLRTKLKTLEKENLDISIEIDVVRKNLQLEDSIYYAISDKLRLFKNQKEPVVSEHAILRYLERVEGVDIEAIKQKILSPKVREYIDTLVSGNFPLEENNKIMIRVKNRVVVSVVNKATD